MDAEDVWVVYEDEAHFLLLKIALGVPKSNLFLLQQIQ